MRLWNDLLFWSIIEADWSDCSLLAVISSITFAAVSWLRRCKYCSWLIFLSSCILIQCYSISLDWSGDISLGSISAPIYCSSLWFWLSSALSATFGNYYSSWFWSWLLFEVFTTTSSTLVCWLGAYSSIGCASLFSGIYSSCLSAANASILISEESSGASLSSKSASFGIPISYSFSASYSFYIRF